MITRHADRKIKIRKCSELKSDTWDWDLVIEKEESIGKCRFTLEKEHIYIDDISVRKEFRNQGVGSCLLSELEIHAKKMGFSEIRGTATAYETEKENYKNELKDWWEKRGYTFPYYSSQTRLIGNFSKKIAQPVGSGQLR